MIEKSFLTFLKRTNFVLCKVPKNKTINCFLPSTCRFNNFHKTFKNEINNQLKILENRDYFLYTLLKIKRKKQPFHIKFVHKAIKNSLYNDDDKNNPI